METLEKYVTPEIEIIAIDNADIITDSFGGDEVSWGGGWGKPNGKSNENF